MRPELNLRFVFDDIDFASSIKTVTAYCLCRLLTSVLESDEFAIQHPTIRLCAFSIH